MENENNQNNINAKKNDEKTELVNKNNEINENKQIEKEQTKNEIINESCTNITQNEINKPKVEQTFCEKKTKEIIEKLNEKNGNKTENNSEKKIKIENPKIVEEEKEKNELPNNNTNSTEENINSYINLTEDGGIKKKIIREGKGEQPTEGKNVFIYFISKYNEREFERTEKNEPFKFTIGENEVIKGWEIAVKSMKIGEKSEFLMTPEYTYGDKQIRDWIPANSILTFEIKLLAIGNNRPENCLENMTYEEKLHWGKLLKAEGVEKFKSGDISSAKECFLKALSFLKLMDINKEEEKEGVDLYLTTLSNICNCFNKEKEYNSVIEISSVGLKVKNLPKLLYFRAIAYAFTEEFDKANDDLNMLTNLLIDNDEGEQKNMENIEQTIKYVKSIIDNRKEIYIEKNKRYSRAIFRQYLYHGKPLKEKLLMPPKKINSENFLVFFEIKIGDNNCSKIIFELFKDITPITAENFRCLCVGNNENLTYKGTYLDKIIKNFVIGGRILENENQKDKCIYGEYFDDENYLYCHCRRGLLTMDNEGKNTNSSKFLITLKDIPWFDGKHVVFGQVIKGMEIIKEIENIETDINDIPLIKVRIENCGEIIEKEKEEIIEEYNKIIEEKEKLEEINKKKEKICEKEHLKENETISNKEDEEKKEDKKEEKAEENEEINEEKKEEKVEENKFKKEEKNEDKKEEQKEDKKEEIKEEKNEDSTKDKKENQKELNE